MSPTVARVGHTHCQAQIPMRKEKKRKEKKRKKERDLIDIIKLWWWHLWYHKKDFDETSLKTPRKVTNNGLSGSYALSRHHHRSPLQLPLVIFLGIVEIVLSRSFCWYWGCYHRSFNVPLGSHSFFSSFDNF